MEDVLVENERKRTHLYVHSEGFSLRGIISLSTVVGLIRRVNRANLQKWFGIVGNLLQCD